MGMRTAIMPVVIGSLVVGVVVGLSLQHYGFPQTAAAETLMADKVIRLEHPILTRDDTSRTRVTLTTPTGGLGVVSTNKFPRNSTTLSQHMKTHKIDCRFPGPPSGPQAIRGQQL